ncbi:hypothetical protein MMC10_006420 [Thelotrema lepadinum]|nr:hypothetical protein [Thelotrema lepadinum]
MAAGTTSSFSLHSFALWLSCVLAILCNVATAALEVLLVVIFSSKHEEVTAVTCVALGFEAASLGTFLLLSGKEAFRKPAGSVHSEGRPHVKHGHFLFGVVLSALAGAVTVAASVWMAVVADRLTQDIRQSPWGFIATLLATTILSTVFQLTFLILLSKRRPTTDMLEESRSMPEIIQVVRPETSKSTIASNPFTNQTEASTPPMSRSSISLRSTTTVPSRTGSSKTRLSFSRPSSKSGEASQFDFAWDTTGVPLSLRDTVYTHVRNNATPLPPIPGSRPVSPAKALDGPFLPPSPHPPQSQPSSPMEATFPNISSPKSPTPAIDAVPLTPPHAPFMDSSTSLDRSRAGSLTSRNESPNFFQPPTSRLHRAGSATSLADSVSHLKTQPSFDEEHIHPLFRANSPTPPPSASRNTIVTAATVLEAEEAIIRPRRKTESRVGSPLAQSPDPSAYSPSLESPEYFTPNDVRKEPTWPMAVSPVSIDEAVSPIFNRDRTNETPTPQNDAPVSPIGLRKEEDDQSGEEKTSSDLASIPNFILAAGSRRSLQDLEARQRKSEYSSNEE